MGEERERHEGKGGGHGVRGGEEPGPDDAGSPAPRHSRGGEREGIPAGLPGEGWLAAGEHTKGQAGRHRAGGPGGAGLSAGGPGGGAALARISGYK